MLTLEPHTRYEEAIFQYLKDNLQFDSTDEDTCQMFDGDYLWQLIDLSEIELALEKDEDYPVTLPRDMRFVIKPI